MRSVYKKKHYVPDKAVYTTKTELFHYLHFLDTNPVIQEFLRHDTSFRLADKYLIAMVFIYFKRAQLSPEDYTNLNFFAGLCLAHSMEEDIEFSSEIYPWALGKELKDELPRLLELKVLLWMAMDYRAAVSRHCCKQEESCTGSSTGAAFKSDTIQQQTTLRESSLEYQLVIKKIMIVLNCKKFNITLNMNISVLSLNLL